MNKNILKWNFVFQYGYVITNIINSIVLLPFYLKKIDASTLGVWLATGNILAWMTLVDPGVGDVLQQKVAELRGKGQGNEIGLTIGSGLLAASGILVLAVLAGFVFYFSIGAIINKDVTQYPHLQSALFITIISTGMSLVSFSISGINQGMQNAAQVAISSILANVLFLIVNLVMLFGGYGIISIAFANLLRALFINTYNFFTLNNLLNRENISIVFNGIHFKKFIRVFSFTSLASIIGGLSASMDTIVLSRFISPGMITIFEINKRPIQLSQSLIGRHSVALMPVVSHAHGQHNRDGILSLISIQFKYYSYATIFFAMLFCFNYHDLITAWLGVGKFAGDTIIYLMAANFFFGLIGYFMANMGYALGDIKRNSLVNIAKGILVGIFLYVGGKHYGIVGILSVLLAGNILVEFIYFSYRLYQLGFLQLHLIKKTVGLWAVVIPITTIAGIVTQYLISVLINSDMYIVKLLLNGILFGFIFLIVTLLLDSVLRDGLAALLRSVLKIRLGGRNFITRVIWPGTKVNSNANSNY